MVTRNSKYYKKKGATTRERLRCPLCGKISEIGNFSQSHRFQILQFTFSGRGKISCKESLKPRPFMESLKEDIANRMLDLLLELTGKLYVEKELEPSHHPTIIPTMHPRMNVPIPPIKPTMHPRMNVPIPPIKPKEVKLNGKTYKNEECKT